MPKPPGPLNKHELMNALESLPGWQGDENGLERDLKFKDFRGAVLFMQACVDGIEKQDHHPVWTNKYNSVHIHLDTFDAGHKVTQNDVDLARFFNSILNSRGQEFGFVHS